MGNKMKFASRKMADCLDPNAVTGLTPKAGRGTRIAFDNSV
jgi:hypothetical protein